MLGQFVFQPGFSWEQGLCNRTVCVSVSTSSSPITFGLIAQLQQGGRGSRGTSGPAGIYNQSRRVRLQVFTAAGVGVAQPGEQCRAAGNGTAMVLLVHPHCTFHTAHSTLHIPHCTSHTAHPAAPSWHWHLTAEPLKPHLLLCYFCKTRWIWEVLLANRLRDGRAASLQSKQG